jgi:hypothetical protein
MLSSPFKAFVSSTYEDLKNHRAHVIKILRRTGVFVDPMEDWTADSDEPKKFSQDRLTDCHFCVLLVSFQRGYVPDNEVNSIVQMEYQAAIAKGIDILVYLLDEHASWPKHFNKLNSDPQVRKWRAALEKKHGRELFSSDPSSSDIAPAIGHWLQKQINPIVASLSEFANKLANHQMVLYNRRAEVISYLQTAHDLIQHTHDELERIPASLKNASLDHGSHHHPPLPISLSLLPYQTY